MAKIITEQEIKKIVEMYRNGKVVSQIAHCTNISECVIRKYGAEHIDEILTDEKKARVDEAVKLYRELNSLTKIRYKTGIRKTEMKLILKNRMSQEEIDRIEKERHDKMVRDVTELRKKGYATATIASKLGCCENYVRVITRGKASICRDEKKIDTGRIKALYDAHWTVPQIVNDLNVRCKRFKSAEVTEEQVREALGL